MGTRRLKITPLRHDILMTLEETGSCRNIPITLTDPGQTSTSVITC